MEIKEINPLRAPIRYNKKKLRAIGYFFFFSKPFILPISYCYNNIGTPLTVFSLACLIKARELRDAKRYKRELKVKDKTVHEIYWSHGFDYKYWAEDLDFKIFKIRFMDMTLSES